jgi:hypothetical protein
VRATLFTTLDCRDCQLEVGAALGPMREKYGQQFEVRTIDIATAENVEYLYQVAEAYGIPRQEVDLPLIIVGEHLLVGEQMAVELPNLVDSYLATGGVDWPSIPAQQETALLPNSDTSASPTTHSNGFTLAIVIMVLMAATLLYSLIALWRGAAFSLPAWADWFIPALIVIGVGVAGYLSYVETQSVCHLRPCRQLQRRPAKPLCKIVRVPARGCAGPAGIHCFAGCLAGAKINPKAQKSICHWFLGIGLPCRDLLALSDLS